MNISTGTPTDLPTDSTDLVITPRVGGDHNSETYWVGGRNLYPDTREKSIYYRMPNNLYISYINVAPQERRRTVNPQRGKI